jgi:CheY-like chemotaxis protein
MKTIAEQTILLIEDNKGDIRLLKEMLSELTDFRYKLIVAETLHDGCEQLKNNAITFIMLDLNLPDSTGKQTFDVLMNFAHNIPIVIFSELNDEE